MLILFTLLTLKFCIIYVVPGDGGSRIEARLNKTWVPHYFCYKKSDWFELWLNVHYLAPEAIDCWADNMRLRSAISRSFLQFYLTNLVGGQREQS